jgi:hypothetical protein
MLKCQAHTTLGLIDLPLKEVNAAESGCDGRDAQKTYKLVANRHNRRHTDQITSVFTTEVTR